MPCYYGTIEIRFINENINEAWAKGAIVAFLIERLTDHPDIHFMGCDVLAVTEEPEMCRDEEGEEVA